MSMHSSFYYFTRPLDETVKRFRNSSRELRKDHRHAAAKLSQAAALKLRRRRAVGEPLHWGERRDESRGGECNDERRDGQHDGVILLFII